MKALLIALVVAGALSGCDAANELAAKVAQDQPPMTLAISSGYKLNVGGHPVPVFGTEKCPPVDPFWEKIFGSDPDADKKTCILITPNAKQVSVTVGLPTGLTAEVWSVERSGDRAMLRRGDGTLIGVDSK